MAYSDIYRKEQLKNWQELPNLFLPPETVAFYNQKIRTTRVDIVEPKVTIPDEDDTGENIDYTYIKYLMRLCLNDYKQYAESKGVVLKNDKINIRIILNEILNDTLPENYYINKKYFYRSLIDWSDYKYYHYKLMDQAIKFNDQRMIHYLIFIKQEDLENWFDEIVNPPPNDDEEDEEDEEEEYLEPPNIENSFASNNCIICCLEKPNILNLPCLHISTCESCEKIGELTKCSICRMVIQRKVKI